MSNSLIPQEIGTFTNQLPAQKQTEVQDVLNQIFTGTENWTKQIESIEVESVNDVMQMQMADTARKNVKQARLSAEKIFDTKREYVQQVKAEFDLEDKMWLKAKQIMQAQFKAIEEKAQWKADFAKRYEAEQKEQRTQTRIAQISLYRNDINRFEFENMTDSVFESFLKGLENEHNARIEAEKQAELERIEAERKREAERLAMLAENERLRKEAEEKEKARLAELTKIEAERKAEQVERDRLAKIHAKKEAELLAKIEAERKERERIENEEKARLLAEKEAERKKQLAEKKAKSAPDKDKLEVIAHQFANFNLPELSTLEGQKVINDVKTLIAKLTNFILEKAETL
jgi:hypothetical protein